VKVENALALDQSVGTDRVVACGKRRELDLGAEFGEGLGDPALALVDVDDDLDWRRPRSGHERIVALASGLRRSRADEDGAHRRRPPLPTAVRRRDAVRVECAGDVGEAPAAGVLEADVLDDAPREGRRAPWCPVLAGFPGQFEVLVEEAFELCVGDQPLSPRRLHRAHGRDDATVDRGDADAEGLGRLLAAVGETLGLDDLLQLARRRPDQLRLGAAMA
jgi:hypothetical protein